MAKRAFDIVFSALGLVVAAPLLLLIGLWLRLEGDGPVFFRQERIGRSGRPFELVKFRTMVPEDGISDEIGVTMSGHPRVKRATGRFLRKTKLDELPQLLNVLWGDMSFVGPRPELARYVRFYPEQYREEVLSVRPGITDWAALRFSNEEAMLEGREDPEEFYVERILPTKVELYRDYLRNRSLWYDLGLILLTVMALLLPPIRKRLQFSAVERQMGSRK